MNVAVDRLDERLSAVTVPPRPRAGWIRAIRDALGMSGRQLANRMGVSQQRVSALEHAEAEGSLTLDSLRNAADALGCDLVYALVPRTPLRDAIHARALAVAQAEAQAIADTMALEDQRVETRRTEDWINDRATKLTGSPRLWDDP
ncbi:mobile mystery protein A [Euzebya pacifica]|uniref:mobile mystery protein A n=1 Tax=Euzebya pacifica TaxID=1608957 RepID=UPI0013E05F31|nr:mobile mystery protein A [Euzebya pacifica]